MDGQTDRQTDRKIHVGVDEKVETDVDRQSMYVHVQLPARLMDERKERKSHAHMYVCVLINREIDKQMYVFSYSFRATQRCWLLWRGLTSHNEVDGEVHLPSCVGKATPVLPSILWGQLEYLQAAVWMDTL